MNVIINHSRGNIITPPSHHLHASFNLFIVLACEGFHHDAHRPNHVVADVRTSNAFACRTFEEIKTCVKMLMDTEAGTGFMHESFHKDNPAKFTRAWFAWQNTLFGELILKLVNEGKLDLLNSIQ